MPPANDLSNHQWRKLMHWLLRNQEWISQEGRTMSEVVDAARFGGDPTRPNRDPRKLGYRYAAAATIRHAAVGVSARLPD
jgi:hypothetical protein